MRDAVQPLNSNCATARRDPTYTGASKQAHQPGVVPQPAQEGSCIHEAETPEKHHTRQPVFPTENISGVLSSCFRHGAQGW